MKDVDGVEIKEGDLVWYLSPACPRPFKVAEVVGRRVVMENGGVSLPTMLSHRSPAYGFDLEPIEEGDSVWAAPHVANILGRRMFLVEKVDKDGDVFVIGRTFPIASRWLTHDAPETIEDIKNDATLHPAIYCAERGIYLGDDPDRETATTAMVRDIISRCISL